ncbi:MULTISPECIES: hypothetical protein [unclassified Pseudomonas]|uniref:hypothetical protein n=1 Tax=unclassified Pseudomonas TaxID=196821 RepID=UPI002AC8B3DA|nr:MULTISPECIES: hypothetical protein [unclassified Pseudomonas]MEB0042879.1 hypothetical protein [Pseudomonas sp. MH10]MEB0123673.1 hypothetical protein [Pseudomonas sp. CCI1.2]WPX65552.1 hypothetical protein RHM59_07885 [Pseudomonas sp. MH10]
MCNIHHRPTARSPRKSKVDNLVKPTVPVADPNDGLIKTSDLDTDVIVTFPVWPGAAYKDSYQLHLNETAVGKIGELDPLPPEGTLLTLSIPVSTELKQDGSYELTHSTVGFPGGAFFLSPPTTIIVDRTAPGTHQLGYMNFPDEAIDGLTATELSAMGNQLTGKIFGYTGLSKDDIIQTYWGNVQGPSLKLIGDEDGSIPIDLVFDKPFLLSLGNVAEATYYTVTDRAGNISLPSRKVTIPLFLTEVTPDLPPPIIESYDGLIDYSDAMARVEVQIPGSSILIEGDEITLHWGPVSLGPFPLDTDDLGEPVVLLFDVDLSTIEQGGNGTIALKYDVIRSSNVVGLSAELEITVNIELPVPGLMDKPTIRGASNTPSAEDNVIDENDFELDATAIINWNAGFDAQKIITLYWGGQEVLETPYTITNSDVAGGRPLLLKVLNTKFKPVGTGIDIRVYYTVTAANNPNTSSSLQQGIIVRSKDELPGGSDGAEPPQFTALNNLNAITRELAEFGAPVFIKPYVNINKGQIIHFTYEAYSDLVGGALEFSWTHTSQPLTEDQVINGYHFVVDRRALDNHCLGHAEAYFQITSDKGTGNSTTASVYVDMRIGGSCS